MRDPVQAALGDEEDLYDVATWEERSLLDAVATTIYRALAAGSRGALVLVAVALLVAQFGLGLYAVVTTPVLGVLAVLSSVPALALVGALWYADETMRDPWLPLAVTFLLAIAFAAIAAAVNTVLQPLSGLVPVVGGALFFFLVVGPAEETVKWLAVRVYAYRTDGFDTVVAGALYGAVAGLGFATVENTIYITRQALQGGVAVTEPLRLAGGIALTRAFVGPGHVIYSAFAGYYLGLAKFNEDHAGPIVVKGILVAALVHGTYNSLVGSLPLGGWTFVLFVLAFDAAFGYLLYRKLSRYWAAYRRATGPESDVDRDDGGTDADIPTGDRDDGAADEDDGGTEPDAEADG